MPSTLENDKWKRWALILYAIGLVVVFLPSVPAGVRSLVDEYRTAFFDYTPSAPRGDDSLSSVEDIRAKLVALEQTLGSMEASASSEKLAAIEAQLNELRISIFGDPETALTIQRLNLEMRSLRDDVDGLRSESRWLFGITLTLALGVLGTVISVIKSSFSLSKSGGADT